MRTEVARIAGPAVFLLLMAIALILIRLLRPVPANLRTRRPGECAVARSAAPPSAHPRDQARMTQEATMNPITRRHRMWARTSGPDRQAERPRITAGSAGDTARARRWRAPGSLARRPPRSCPAVRRQRRRPPDPHAARPASTGIFDGARGTGHVRVDAATHQETLSGTLILIPQEGDKRHRSPPAPQQAGKPSGPH